MTPKTSQDLVNETKQGIENLSPAEVQAELATGVLLMDIREPEELTQAGKIAGSIHAPRGLLEFYADPAAPSYKKEFEKGKRIILQCAAGARSALAVKTLLQMGYEDVAHLDGGLKAWKEAGLPVEY